MAVIDGILGGAHNAAIDHEIISVTPHDNGIITQVPQQLYYYTNTVLPYTSKTRDIKKEQKIIID